MTEIKICGLSTPPTLAAALDAGADYVGFVFFPPSPRHLSLAAARDIAARVEGRAKIVALTVDADDGAIDAIVAAVSPAALQLHGAETPARAGALRARTGTAIWKAVGVSSADDVSRANDYVGVVDRILFDAKPPRGAVLPGGNGAAFDWSVLAGGVARPNGFMLSGGLTANNVADALRTTGASAVDVSSGVERAPGEKDERMIRDFIATVRGVSVDRGSR